MFSWISFFISIVNFSAEEEKEDNDVRDAMSYNVGDKSLHSSIESNDIRRVPTKIMPLQKE